MGESKRKLIKTYAVSGYMEFIASIPVYPGKTVQLHFTGGKQNGFGVTPAKFTTADPVLQKIIEKSEQYRSGLIKLFTR